MAFDAMWRRELKAYPTPLNRWKLLVVTTLVTVALYYELYVLGSASPLIIAAFHWTFKSYIYVTLLSSIFGMISAYAGGIGDRMGRSNLLLMGTGLSVILTFVLSTMHSGTVFIMIYCGLGVVEGFALVMTSALIRDFSPRVGRALAMGFWTVGPVGGSYLSSKIGGALITGPDSWRKLYVVAATFSLVAWVICFILIRDLPANLRNEIVAEAEGGDDVVVQAPTEEISEKPSLSERLNWRIIVPAAGVSFYLLLYITAVGVFPLYLSTEFKFTLATANNMMSVFWLVNIGAVLIWGALSDRLRVRKSFAMAGAVMMLIMTLVFASRLGKPTSQAEMTVILAIMGAVVACGFGPWMAGLTETIEDINPARVASGLAVYGVVNRAIIAGASFALPNVIALPGGWKAWWWVCAIGIVLFMPTIPALIGPWSPRKAKALAQAAAIPASATAGVGAVPSPRNPAQAAPTPSKSTTK